MNILVGEYTVYNSGVLILSSDKSITMKIEDTDFIFDFRGEDEAPPLVQLIEPNDNISHLNL